MIKGLLSTLISVAAGWTTPVVHTVGCDEDGNPAASVALLVNPEVSTPVLRARQIDLMNASTQVLYAHAHMRYTLNYVEGEA